MNVTANIVCYKSKTLANGEHPLMVRICKDGKKKYKSLGVSVNPKHWNFERNTLKPNCPNYEYLSSLLSFNKHLDICFSDIDVCFLRRYETWLRKQGLAENTIGIRFRTLRAIYNLAIEENMEQRRSSVAGLTEYPTDSVHEEWQVGDTVQLRTEPFEL